MSLRPANRSDEAFFYYWRRREEKAGLKGGWYAGQQTTREAHAKWFAERLHVARLLVWERFGEDVGVARIDSNGELSFSTEPQWAVRMLEELLWFSTLYGGRLKVTVDLGDGQRAAALEAAGFQVYPAVFYAYRPPKEQAA